MANERNLKPVRSTDEAKRLGTVGGKKSGETRRQRRAMRETLLELLKMPATEREGMDFETAGLIAMLEKWARGDVAAGVFIRDTIGEKPVEKRGVAMQTEVTLTKEQRDAVYRLAIESAMGGEYPDRQFWTR